VIGAEMAAVCDVYEPNLQAVSEGRVDGAKPFSDYRRLLDDKSIQAGDHLDAGPLARTHGDGRSEAGQGHLCREAMCH